MDSSTTNFDFLSNLNDDDDEEKGGGRIYDDEGFSTAQIKLVSSHFIILIII